MRKYTKTHAIIFDGQAIFADALSLVLERLDYFIAVSIAQHEQDLRSQLNKIGESPVVLYLDYYIPDCNAIHLMSDIRKLYTNVKIIVISNINNPTIIKSIYEQRPIAILSKAARISEVIACLGFVEKDEEYFSGFILKMLEEKHLHKDKISFTTKEIEVLQYIARGKSIQQTAEALHISKHTVVSHRRNMMAKTNCHSATELLSYCRAIDLGLTEN